MPTPRNFTRGDGRAVRKNHRRERVRPPSRAHITNGCSTSPSVRSLDSGLIDREHLCRQALGLVSPEDVENIWAYKGSDAFDADADADALTNERLGRTVLPQRKSRSFRRERLRLAGRHPRRRNARSSNGTMAPRVPRLHDRDSPRRQHVCHLAGSVRMSDASQILRGRILARRPRTSSPARRSREPPPLPWT